jgi:DNA-binding transcriptional LysR family regulator
MPAAVYSRSRRPEVKVAGMDFRQLRYFLTLAEELERCTHHVGLTAAGAVFLVEPRQIIARVDRAVQVARCAVESSPSLRAGIIDAGSTGCRRCCTTCRPAIAI